MAKATPTGRISWKRFEKEFPLIKNHLDPHAAFEGCMFETYGKELEFVNSLAGTNRVLTIVDGDGDKLEISTGYHFVNRVGYLITEKPYEFDFWLTC